MIMMRAPEGLTGFTHQGYPVEIRDGVARVDPRFRGEFETHGFLVEGDAPAPVAPVPVPAAQQMTAPAPAAAPTMDLRKRALLDAYARHLETLSDAEIDGTLEMLRRSETAPPPITAPAAVEEDDDEDDAEDQPGGFDPLAVTAADLDGLKRPQLFAVLKARSIPAVPPISNEALREKARKALAG